MNFRQWFYTEVGTSTASIAMFARPVFGGHMASRLFPQMITFNDDEDKCEKHKKHKKHKKKED